MQCLQYFKKLNKTFLDGFRDKNFYHRKMNLVTEFCDDNFISNKRLKDHLTTSISKFEIDFDTKLSPLRVFFPFLQQIQKFET